MKNWIVAILFQAVISEAFTDNDFLTLKEGRFTTKSGKTVLLQGVNIGGWLIQESWFCPVNGDYQKWANLDSIEALQQRFTTDQIYELYTIYEDNWFTTWDLDYIAGLGINALRVPFWYRNFMLTPEGKWINEDFDKNPGFIKLDWVITEAGKRGIYVILDVHGAPGGQSTDFTTGTLNKNDLYTTPAYIEAFKSLWIAIADRYKSNPAVAMYDIMNEANDNNGHQLPNHSFDMDDPATWDITNDMYDVIYKAIRSVDSNHLISMEAVWLLARLPDPSARGWNGVVYQLHLYDDNALHDVKKCATELSEYSRVHGVGAYNGEFSNPDDIDVLNAVNVSWTTWTYKGVRGSMGDWFMQTKTAEVADMVHDSFDDIKRKWGTVLRTENGFTESRVGPFVKAHIKK